MWLNTMKMEQQRESSTIKLKHTTVQGNKPFTISGLKGTIEGFSKRYQQHSKEKSLQGVSFTVITNRPVDQSFKENLAGLIKEERYISSLIKRLKSNTQLDGKPLIDFLQST